MRQRQHLEMLIGILGFFTVMAFIAAVGGIVGGDPWRPDPTTGSCTREFPEYIHA